MTTTLMRCRSLPQIASLGPVPPRTPGRPDAQVPRDLAEGPTRYARIAHLYFYDEAASADPAFGFVDVEISVQRIGDRCDVEIYCVGDGYQSGSGTSDGHPLRIEFCAGDTILGHVEWAYADVMTGRSDPLTFRTTITLDAAGFTAADRVHLPAATAACRPHLD